MPDIYAIGHSIFSPLGANSLQNFLAVKARQTGVRQQSDSRISADPFWASTLSEEQLATLNSQYPESANQLSPFEQLCLRAIEDAVQQTTVDIANEDCLLLISSTKGNIEWLETATEERMSLQHSAQLIAKHLKLKNAPVVVSNACISGSLALIMARRMLEVGKYKQAVVVGCDRFSGFIHNGFQSFHALAEGLCRPFDKDRKGINLGEAAACIVLSADKSLGSGVPLAIIAGGGLSNDANHLSGPSRTGAELAAAIEKAIAETGCSPQQIGAISAHGTATVFNDEMESKALQLAGVSHAPLHSLKSYTGHTLGAAGIIESIIACMAMAENLHPATPGFEDTGVSNAVNIANNNREGSYHYLLKTASGFGGCNAALVWKKYDPNSLS